MVVPMSILILFVGLNHSNQRNLDSSLIVGQCQKKLEESSMNSCFLVKSSDGIKFCICVLRYFHDQCICN
jgi:hypothetical protein